jgi:hypothetical protein
MRIAVDLAMAIQSGSLPFLSSPKTQSLEITSVTGARSMGSFPIIRYNQICFTGNLSGEM